MLLVLEIAMLIVGLVALCTGKITLTKTAGYEGPSARLAGLAFVLPLPLALCVGLAIGSTVRSLQELQEMRGTLIAVEVAIILAGLIGGIVLAVRGQPLTPTQAPPRRGEPKEEPGDSEEEEYLRRRAAWQARQRPEGEEDPTAAVEPQTPPRPQRRAEPPPLAEPVVRRPQRRPQVQSEALPTVEPVRRPRPQTEPDDEPEASSGVPWFA